MDIVNRVITLFESKQVGNGAELTAQQLKRIGLLAQSIGKPVTTITSTLSRMQNEGFSTKAILRNTTAIRSFRGQIRTLNAFMPGFRGELLSAMFLFRGLGMAMQSMLRPALEVFGIFNILKAALIVVFAPIVSLILPVIIKLAKWFMGLSESTKLFIGIFVLIMAVVAPIAAVLAALGILSATLSIAFGTLIGWIALAIGAIVVLAMGIMIFIKQVWPAIKSFFTNLREGIKDLGDKAYNWGADFFTNLLNGMKSVWGTFKEWISSAWDWIASIFSFDMATNDAMAKKWGSDMLENFAKGVQENRFTALAPNINVTASVSNDIDMGSLASVIAGQLQTEMGRYGA